jgi:hypothetical protein
VAGGAPRCGRRAGGGGVSTRRQSATFGFIDVFWVFLMNLLVAQKLILKIWCLSLRLFLGHGVGDLWSSYPF